MAPIFENVVKHILQKRYPQHPPTNSRRGTLLNLDKTNLHLKTKKWSITYCVICAVYCLYPLLHVVTRINIPTYSRHCSVGPYRWWSSDQPPRIRATVLIAPVRGLDATVYDAHILIYYNIMAPWFGLSDWFNFLEDY